MVTETDKKQSPAPIDPPQKDEPAIVRTLADTHVRGLLTEAGLAETVPLEQGLRQLSAQAKDGRAYRASLVTEAKEQGIRAHGTEFKESVYLPMFERASIEELRTFIADFKSIGDASHKGGRLTREGHEPPEEKAADNSAPLYAFTG